MKLLVKFSIVLFILTGCAPASNPDAMQTVTREFEIYFVSDTPRGVKLFSEIREFKASDGTFATEILSQLISGALQPLDPDYSNLWNESNSLNQVLVSGATATVDINLGKLNVGSESELRAIEQLVWTLTSINPNVTTVRFLVDGEAVETFAGHIDTKVDFKRVPEYEVLNPIQIESILDGTKLVNPVVISGKACTFEANVVWELRANGERVDQGFTTADAACPQRSEWKVNLGRLSPGDYLFIAQEFSAEDGSLFASDSKAFKVD
jgi:hypothetical protein